ncbi:hypothetical protein WMF18_12855 [Sorangium sp. So ce315]
MNRRYFSPAPPNKPMVLIVRRARQHIGQPFGGRASVAGVPSLK